MAKMVLKMHKVEWESIYNCMLACMINEGWFETDEEAEAWADELFWVAVHRFLDEAGIKLKVKNKK